MKSSLSSRSLWWSFLLLVLLVLGLVLLPALGGYGLDQTELLNELKAISSELDESAQYIENGLNKVENSLNQQDEKLRKLEERLLKAEQQLQQADRALTISEQDLQNFEEQINVLQTSFDDYRRKQERKNKLLKLGLGAALVAILVESLILAFR